LKLWGTDGGKEILSRPLGARQTTALAFTLDGKTLALATGDGGDGDPLMMKNNAIEILDVATGKEGARLTGPERSIRALAFSPDGKALFSAEDDYTVRRWDVPSGTERSRFSLPFRADQWFPYVAFSADANLLAVCEHFGDTITVWDVSAGREVHRFPVAGSVGNALAFSADGRTLAAGALQLSRAREPKDYSVHLWEMASAREVATIHPDGQAVRSLAFSPDGRTLTSGMNDGTALIWDVTGRASGGGAPVKPEAAWEALAGEDAAKAAQAGWVLVSVPEQAVALLGERLRPAAPVDPQRLARLIADLDSDKFAVRQRASADLEALAEAALPALRRHLDGKPPLEIRRRVETVIERVTGPTLSSDRLRTVRAVAVLEQVGTPAAGKVLESLSAGPHEALATREAKAALARLERRKGR
jgi:WD40 repeat protein